MPAWVYEQLLDRARAEAATGDSEDADFTRGPLISRFSFAIDVREWGFVDPSAALVREARNKPEVRAIAEADVWDERGDERSGPGRARGRLVLYTVSHAEAGLARVAGRTR